MLQRLMAALLLSVGVCTASAQNLIVNGEFDQDDFGWNASDSLATNFTSLDWDNASDSGSVKVANNLTWSTLGILWQCVAVQAPGVPREIGDLDVEVAQDPCERQWRESRIALRRIAESDIQVLSAADEDLDVNEIADFGTLEESTEFFSEDRARRIDENMPHSLRRRRKKMSPPFKASFLLAVQSQPSLMHQRCRLECVAGSLAGHLMRRQFAQLLINQRQQFRCGIGIAVVNGTEKSGDVAHIGAERL